MDQEITHVHSRNALTWHIYPPSKTPKAQPWSSMQTTSKETIGNLTLCPNTWIQIDLGRDGLHWAYLCEMRRHSPNPGPGPSPSPSQTSAFASKRSSKPQVLLLVNWAYDPFDRPEGLTSETVRATEARKRVLRRNGMEMGIEIRLGGREGTEVLLVLSTHFQILGQGAIVGCLGVQEEEDGDEDGVTMTERGGDGRRVVLCERIWIDRVTGVLQEGRLVAPAEFQCDDDEEHEQASQSDARNGDYVPEFWPGRFTRFAASTKHGRHRRSKDDDADDADGEENEAYEAPATLSDPQDDDYVPEIWPSPCTRSVVSGKRARNVSSDEDDTDDDA